MRHIVEGRHNNAMQPTGASPTMDRPPDTRPYWPNALRLALWCVALFVGSWSIRHLLGHFPYVALGAACLLASIVTLGVIINLNELLHSRTCRRRRWWARYVGPDQLLYEERDPQLNLRTLRFFYRQIGTAPHGVPVWEVDTPDPLAWDERMPNWASGRRAQIIDRIDAAFGRGTVFQFR